MDSFSNFVASFAPENGVAAMPGSNKRAATESAEHSKPQRRLGGGLPGRGRGGGASASVPNGGGRGAPSGGKGSNSRLNSGDQRGYASGRGFEPSLGDTVTLHGRLLQRLARNVREENRYSQFVINLSNSEARELVFNTGLHWKSKRPERGPHPSGDIGSCQWMVYIEWLARESKQEVATESQQKWATTLETWAKGSIYAVPAQGTAAASWRTYIRTFVPIGLKDRIPDSDRPWLWLLRFDLTRSQGRNCHEATLELMDTFVEHGVEIRLDRSPMDALERDLMDSLRL